MSEKMSMIEKEQTKLSVRKKGDLPILVAENLAMAEQLAKIAAHGTGKPVGDLTYIILKGQELGIPPLTASEEINLIPSKDKKTPFMSSRLLAALVRESGKCKEMHLEIQGEGEDRICIARGQRVESKAVHEFRVKFKEVKGKSWAWDQHPEAMLRARASAILCRAVWPEVILGMAVEGEEHYHTEKEPVEMIVESDQTSPWKDKEPETEITVEEEPPKQEKPKKKTRAKKKEEQPEEAKEAPPEPPKEEAKDGDGDEDTAW